MKKAKLRRSSFQWHTKLAWVGAFALLSFVVSGIIHPLLSWTGPQSAAFMPPRAVMQAQQLQAVPSILKRHNIQLAIMVKLVPSEQGVVLQVTEDNNQPRRYFDLKTQQELPDFDHQQAQWLARYYTFGAQGSEKTMGDSAQIASIDFQTEFDSAYPWVNRLLPVYKVRFAGDQGLTAYVYTEINALAGLGNHYKTRLQSVFRALHTWSWLEGFQQVRLILMALLLTCALLMLVSGVGLVFLLKKRQQMTAKARIHRGLAYALWLPLLGFMISGFWHLLHYGFNDLDVNDWGYSEMHRGLKLGQPIDLAAMQSASTQLSDLPGQPLNQISIIQHQGQLYYRLSVPAKRQDKNTKLIDEHSHHSPSTLDKSSKATRQARFKGQATEIGGQYYAVATGQKADLNDQQLARAIAVKQLGLSDASISNLQLVTHFGPHYDFRNKRLPVWQIDFDSELGDKVFIDPATGIMVDRLVDSDRYEGYSFSFLHKWNFLTPLTGRFWRDIFIVVMMLATIVLVGLGGLMKLRRKKQH